MRNKIISSLKRGEITRTITFVRKKDGSKKSKMLAIDLNLSLQDVNKNIKKRLEDIAIAWHPPKQIRIIQTSPPSPTYKGNVSDIFDVLMPNEINDLRVIVKFEKYDSSELKKYIETNSISHLVEISVLESATDDLNENNSSCATLYSKKPDSIFRIIEDIMLDISMYHTIISPILNKQTLDFRKRFSYVKILHAQKKNLESLVWNLNKNKGYISLAGYFRKNDDFEIKDYVNCWLEIQKVIYEQYPELIKVNINDFENELRRHKNYKQLPVKKILKLFNNLSPGKYILIRINEKPNTRKKAKSILPNFRIKGVDGRGSLGKYKIGRVNILPGKELKEIKKYLPYISIFKFNKP